MSLAQKIAGVLAENAVQFNAELPELNVAVMVKRVWILIKDYVARKAWNTAMVDHKRSAMIRERRSVCQMEKHATPNMFVVINAVHLIKVVAAVVYVLHFYQLAAMEYFVN